MRKDSLKNVKKDYREEMPVVLKLKVKTAAFLKKIKNESKKPKFEI